MKKGDKMPTHKVKLIANEGIFEGLAKQNMLFHQCVGELIDNAIAATASHDKFRVDVILLTNEENRDVVELYIADNCEGMELERLKKALQLGEPPESDNRLNEHGFGMKNALATISGGNKTWELWTRPKNGNKVFLVKGPFSPSMVIEEVSNYPSETFLPVDISTLIHVQVKLSTMQTVRGRGAPARDLNILRKWLVEHLGVMYRGYLEQDQETNENSGVINVCIGTDSTKVPPVPVPLGNSQTEYIEVELAGTVYTLTYNFGTLDEVKRDSLVRGEKAKYYYQQNQKTQGIEIRLGKRTIATMQFETIWKTEDGDSQLTRHNNYNDFVGELRIPELPKGVLTTTNNKTDFNLDDPDWAKIFEKLNEIRPTKNIREHSEAALRKKWMNMLKATNPEDNISDEVCVWPTGTRVDVFRETNDGKIIIYEVKVGTGTPIHLYQLKMYWDGLVIQGQQPKEAVLLVEDFNTNLEEMANQMNRLSPPNESEPYNFKIETHRDKQIIE